MSKAKGNPDTREMVNRFLIEKRFQGLYNEDTGCACGFDDLAQCGEIKNDCRAGYSTKATCGYHDFHIGPTRRRICICDQ